MKTRLTIMALVTAALAACAPTAVAGDDPEQRIRSAIQRNNPGGMPQYCDIVNHWGMDRSIAETKAYHQSHGHPWTDQWGTAMRDIYDAECR